MLLDGWRQWFSTTLVVVLVSGAAVWLLAPVGSITLGASGVVFGWLTYLVVRGFYTGSAGQIALGLVIFVLYGGMLWGVLPSDAGVSWQAHLGGALGGFLAARSRGRVAATTPTASVPTLTPANTPLPTALDFAAGSGPFRCGTQ